MEDKVIRRKFESHVLRTAGLSPHIFYARRVDECVVIDGRILWNTAILPHPDVSLKEFFNR